MTTSHGSEPIAAIGLSIRANVALMKAGFKTVDDVEMLLRQNAPAIPNLDENLLDEISYRYAKYIAGKRRPDYTPLNVLGLSARPHNALIRNGINSVDDVAQMSDEQILEIRGMGGLSLKEIREKLADYRCYTGLGVVEDTSANAKETEAQDGASAVMQTPLSALGLSVRPHNALMRAGIKTVESLRAMSEEEILAVYSIGTHSLAEIKEKLAGRPESPIPMIAGSRCEAETPVQMRLGPLRLDADLVSLLKQAGDQVKDISLDRLVLPEALQGYLKQKGVSTLGNLVEQQRGDLPNEELLMRRLEMYLRWYVKQEAKARISETQGQCVSPLHRAILAGMSLDGIIDKWLSVLPERSRSVVRWRYGLDGEELTLEEVGARIGVTRERVRQLQKRAVKKLGRSLSFRPTSSVVRLIRACIAEAGGLANEKQVKDLLKREMPVDRLDLGKATHLLLEFEDDVVWLKHTYAWGLMSLPLQCVGAIQKQLAEYLDRERVPLGSDQLVASIMNSDLYTEYAGALSHQFVVACLRVHPDIVADDEERYGLRSWEQRRTDEMILALRGIGEPAHYRKIAAKANELLEPALQTSAHNIHAFLIRYDDVFVRVGHGIYGLKEWGLQDDGNVANAAYRVLREAGRPLHFDVIADEVLKTWRVKTTSVHMALESDERICRIGPGVYCIRDLLSDTEHMPPQSGFGDLFGAKLARWQSELDRRSSAGAADTRAEVDAIREAGPDFLSD